MPSDRYYKSDLVSVIILNYETPDLTANCINSVLKSTYNQLEIIVLDNGSRSDDLRHLEQNFTGLRVRFYRSETNLGFAEGCDYALQFCHGSYLMLLNSDTEVEPDWLEPLVSFLKENLQVAVAQSKLLSLKNKGYFEYAGAAGGLMDIFGYPFTRGRIFKTVEEDKGQYDTPIKIAWAVGTAMFIRRRVVDEINLFDPIYFTYGEEADFCFRAYSCGWKVYSVPESIVYHLGAATSGKNILKKLHFNHRNGWILILKNYPLQLLLPVLPIRFLLDLLNIVYYIFSNQATFVLSVFWAWVELLLMLPKIIKARSDNSKLSSRRQSENNLPPIYHGSIVVDYFLLGKHTYKRLLG